MLPDPHSRLHARLKHPSLGLGLNLSLSQGGQFNPGILFANGEQGAWYDPSDLSSMFQDAGGTTPAAVDAVVGLIRDKSGKGNHASQSTTANKPILRLSGGRYYLEFDGTDDYFQTSAINFSASDKVTAWAGITKSAGSSGVVIELGTSTAGGNTGFFSLWAPWDATNEYAWISKGNGTRADAFGDNAAYASPHTAILTGIGDISGDSAILRVNGAQAATSAADQGSGNYNSGYVLNIGRRNAASLPFNGRLYGLIIRGAASDASAINRTETYLNIKTGAY
jgi:hypothetical protein